MADRVKLFIKKLTSLTALKKQITSLTNLFEQERYDEIALKLRMSRIVQLYHAYEKFNDKLVVLDPM